MNILCHSYNAILFYNVIYIIIYYLYSESISSVFDNLMIYFIFDHILLYHILLYSMIPFKPNT